MTPPYEPTPEMIKAAVAREPQTDGCCIYTDIWKAMYAAGIETITEDGDFITTCANAAARINKRSE